MNDNTKVIENLVECIAKLSYIVSLRPDTQIIEVKETLISKLKSLVSARIDNIKVHITTIENLLKEGEDDNLAISLIACNSELSFMQNISRIVS